MFRVYRYVDAVLPVDTGISITCKAKSLDVVRALKAKGIVKRNARNALFTLRNGKIVFHKREGFLFELRKVPESGFYRYFSLSHDPAQNVVCLSCSQYVRGQDRRELVNEINRECHFCGEKV